MTSNRVHHEQTMRKLDRLQWRPLQEPAAAHERAVELGKAWRVDAGGGDFRVVGRWRIQAERLAKRQPNVVKIIVAQEKSPAHRQWFPWWLILRDSPPSGTVPRRKRHDDDFDSQKHSHRGDDQLVCEPS